MNSSAVKASPSKNPLWKALVVLAFFLGVIFLVEFLWSKDTGKAVDSSFSQIRPSFDTIMSDAPFEDMRRKLSAGFEDEVLDLTEYSDVYVSERGGVMGFMASSGAEELFNTCSKELCDKGWTRVESGRKTTASFIKSTGNFNWIFLDCIAEGYETLAVIQVS